MNIVIRFLLILLSVYCEYSKKVRFDSYKVVELKPIGQELVDYLVDMEADIWSNNGESVISFMSPLQVREIQESGLCEMEFGSENIQALIDDEDNRLNVQPSSAFSVDQWFTEYHRYDEIVKWYNQLAMKFPDLVSVEDSIGKTHEGRDIIAVRVTNTKSDLKKSKIWIQSLQHAREWISGATTQYIVHKLLTDYETDSTFLDTVDLYVIPVVNPDGYEYTFDVNRMWRKNRRNNFRGFGVDLNRNWDDHWAMKGTSNNPRSEIYHGPSAASEPEVKALAAYFLKQRDIIAAIDFHSFSQLILRPYGWTRNDGEHERNHAVVSDLMAKAIKLKSGKSYAPKKSTDLVNVFNFSIRLVEVLRIGFMASKSEEVLGKELTVLQLN